MSRPQRALRFAGLTGAALAFATAALADPPCPASSYSLYTSGPFTTTAPTLDQTSTPYPGGEYHVTYNLPLATVSMRQCCSLAGASVDAFDAYDMTGVPAGTTVGFTANFTVDGMVWTDGCGGTGCGGYVSIHVGSGAASSDTTYSFGLFSGSRTFHDVRRLPITMVAGTPVVIDFKLRGARSPGGAHGSSGDGVISFSDVPPGASIRSCQGYPGQPTPARRVSWGAVKTIYR